MLEAIKRHVRNNVIVSKLLGLEAPNSLKNVFRLVGNYLKLG